MRALLGMVGPLLSCLLLGACAPEVEGAPAFGFHAYHVVPNETDFGEFDRTYAWRDGPHERFEALDVGRVARDSLAWFEASAEASAWRGQPGLQLELVYPSGARTISACHVPGSEPSWEEDLRAWFERFPPGGDGAPEVGEVSYPWTVGFGSRGKVSGVAETDLAALETMKSLAAGLGPAPLFAGPSFQLLATVRRSAHETDVFGADAESLAELDDLPRIVREKRAERGE